MKSGNQEPRPAASNRSTARARLAKYAFAYVFIAPVVLGAALFIFVPMAMSFVWSLTDYNGVQAPEFVGLRNYAKLFTDLRFYESLRNTLIYVVLGMLVGPALGLSTALLLNRKVKFQGFFRTAYFLPVMTSAIVVAMVWRLILNQRGVLNYALGLFGAAPSLWLSDPKLVMLSISIAGIWQGFGFETVVFLAALQSVPKDLYEAATLDGAGAWRKFVHVTLPSLKPVLFFVYCVGLIGSFQVFDLPYTLMRAHPNPGPEYSTIVYYLFSKFRDLRLGYASAIAYVLFVILLAVSFVQWRFKGKED